MAVWSRNSARLGIRPKDLLSSQDLRKSELLLRAKESPAEAGLGGNNVHDRHSCTADQNDGGSWLPAACIHWVGASTASRRLR